MTGSISLLSSAFAGKGDDVDSFKMHIIFFNILISFVYFSVDVKMQISRSKLFDSSVGRPPPTAAAPVWLAVHCTV